MKATIENLMLFIHNHDVDAWIADGKLFAEDVYTTRSNDGIVNVHRETVQINPTVKAVKEFLNY